MGKIARQILSLLPVTGLDVSRELLSPRAGQRLIADLSLIAGRTVTAARNSLRRLPSAKGSPTTRAGPSGHPAASSS